MCGFKNIHVLIIAQNKFLILSCLFLVFGLKLKQQKLISTVLQVSRLKHYILRNGMTSSSQTIQMWLLCYNCILQL